MNAKSLFDKLKSDFPDQSVSIEVSLNNYGGKDSADNVGIAGYIHEKSSRVQILSGKSFQQIADLADLYRATREVLDDLANSTAVAPLTPDPEQADKERDAYIAHAKDEGEEAYRLHTDTRL